ncbi:hypothetical protein B566_EDAN006553 [Ephemera danica]|nr:hypothetical protein B566_EDAN006553 [Ephemera danica]
MTLNSYLQQVGDAWEDGRGDLLASLLSLRDPHIMSPKLQAEKADETVEEYLTSPLSDMVSNHIRALRAFSMAQWTNAFDCQCAVVSSVTKWLQGQRDENWGLGLMLVACVDLRLTALSAEKEQRQAGAPRKLDFLEKAAESIMGCFRICASDNRSAEEDSKRWGMLALVNQLFKVYFGINKLHLCRPLIRAIESSTFKDGFSLGQRVTYRYYTGRKAVFDSDYKLAEEYLTFAFEKCHRESRKNKRLILIYLTPVKMLLGYMPRRSVLEKYNLLPFWEVAQAVKVGSAAKLGEAMQKHEAFFIRCGVYIILQKLEMITFRNLFKRVYGIMQTHQLPISALLTALRCGGVTDADEDETQCIVANLISDGRIKGYISHQHQMLVVSKQNAFPKLASVAPTATS